ncbi:hypothetical protein BO78DRAFT_116777 [Aspergillus sclerotiicarbonarius CBS 121057]|uniref:Uncharacterized protein n=1 Tax=Aspergillus sclerotiicarbonarius (strain CBS 121057 / IBT 28362) TaxID=1448318 RepID=A0A319EWE7_ASPSB|nr:hypothetical protein BO78DRAFT_116777 [Aspergillus sclerotiicarbonarius CBS 121057]
MDSLMISKKPIGQISRVKSRWGWDAKPLAVLPVLVLFQLCEQWPVIHRLNSANVGTYYLKDGASATSSGPAACYGPTKVKQHVSAVLYIRVPEMRHCLVVLCWGIIGEP